MTNRADRFIPKIDKDFYRDILMDFSRNPVTGYLGQVTNEQCAGQLLRCTILTSVGEWPFEPDNGSHVRRAQFEPNDPISLDTLRSTVQEAIRGRLSTVIDLIGVKIEPIRLGDGVSIHVLYRLQGREQLASLAVVLKRVR